ncbi:MAG: hypothetical protein OXT67_08570 [Zetaproteobacteria bacterium]|nr:hypothetical protein [Zetaproteobacteria bacterium]
MKSTYLGQKVFLEHRRGDFVYGTIFALAYTVVFHLSGYNFSCYVEAQEVPMSWNQLFLLFASMVNLSFFFIVFGRAALKKQSYT